MHARKCMKLICRDENIENGVDFKFLLVSTAPALTFVLEVDESVVKVNS